MRARSQPSSAIRCHVATEFAMGRGAAVGDFDGGFEGFFGGEDAAREAGGGHGGIAEAAVFGVTTRREPWA